MYKKAAAKKCSGLFTCSKQRVQRRDAAEVLRARSPKQRFGDRVPNCPFGATKQRMIVP